MKRLTDMTVAAARLAVGVVFGMLAFILMVAAVSIAFASLICYALSGFLK